MPGQIFLQTDKDDTKDCPCTAPGCENFVRVNKFYAPAKAKCPDHGGDASAVVGEVTGEMEMSNSKDIPTIIADPEDENAKPNARLGKMMCPVCDDTPLQILAVTEGGHIDLGCYECNLVVGLTFNFMHSQIRSVPKDLTDLVDAFNYKQIGQNYDVSLRQKMGKFFG